MKKRILALLMSLCMIFSMVPVLGVSAAETEAEVSLASIGFQSNYPRYLVYLDLADVTDVSDTTVPGGSKVVADVNGSAMNLWAYAASASQVFLVFEVDLGSYLLEIDAGTAIGSYTVKSDLKIKIDEYSATELEIVRLGIDTSVGSSGVIYNAGGAARYSFALSGISEQTGTVGSLSINGNSVTSGFEYYANYPASGNQALFVYYDALMSGAADAGDITELQTISIPEGTVFGNCITGNTLTFTIQQWTFAVLPEAVSILSTDGSAWNGSQYIFYLHTDPSYTLTSAQAVTLLVNGTEQKVWLNPGDTPFISCETAIAFGENKIVVPAGTQLGDCVTAQEYTFYTHADGGIDQNAPDNGVSFTFASGSWQEDNSRYLAYLNHDLGEDMTVAWAPLDILSVDGSDVSVYATGGSQLMLVLDSTVGITALGEHEITLKAGSYIGDYEIANDVTFYTHADGTVNQTPPAAPVSFTFASGSWQEDNSRYLAYLNHDLGEDMTVAWTPLDILTVDGSDVSVYAIGGSQLMLVLDSTVGITALGEHEITLKAGTYIGDYEIANDVTFYTHKDGTVDAVPAAAATVNISSVDTALSKHNGTEYHIYLNMTDPAFELGDAYSNTVMPVLVDGAVTNVSIFSNGAGSLLIAGWTNISLGKHTVTIPAGTAIGDYVLENAYSLRTYSGGTVGEVDRGQVILSNASAMMGGSYGDGLFYDLSGSFTGANWIVNAIPADGNITMEYAINSEAKDSAWYGPARLVNLNNQWPNVFGVVLFTASTTFANEYGLTNMAFAYNADEHLAYFRNSAGNMQAVPADYGYITSWDTYMTDDLLSSQDFAGIDEKGAQYYGIGWGGSGTYTLDWTKLMIYDAQGNDLGVTWHADGADVTLTPMVEYGATVYLKAADNSGLTVTGWKVTDLEGNQISVEATQREDGIWYFVVPEDTMSIEPVYSSVDLTVTDSDGKVLVQSNIAWLSSNIQLAAKQVQAAIPAGHVLKGYEVDGALYPSLESIPDAANAGALNVTAVTVQFEVREQAEIRHGETLDDSGLRFVATLGQTEYIPKVLVIADSEDKLSVADAQWKIGNPYNADFSEIVCVDGTVCYSIVLTNIPAADYSKTYYARAGILVTYADGSSDYIYTDAVSSTVNQAAQNTSIQSAAREAYIDGVMNLDADAELIGSYSYTVSVDKTSGDYVITYQGGDVSVSALTIDGQRFTADDGVVFADGTVTVPSGLFANAKLKKELTETGSMNIGAYYGPSVGSYQYTESSGAVSDHSIKRTHDAVYADVEDYFGAGFNIWMAEDWKYGGTQYSENDAFSALDLAAEYCINHGLTGADIQVLVADSFINGLLDGTDMNNGDRNDVATYANIAKERINALISYNPVVNGVEVGTEYNCFAGYMLRDEPLYEHMAYYTGWFNFLAADEGQSAAVTAWNTSGQEISGSVSCMGLLEKGYTLYFSMLGMGTEKNYVTDSSSTEACTEAEYVAYVKAFVDNVNATVWSHDNMVLAFDNYGLYSDASSSFGSTSVSYTEQTSDNWQQNLSLFADLVSSNNPNAKFAAALRSFGMTRKSMVSRWTSKSWKEFQAFDSSWGEQAVSMQAYTALAHGYMDISYFSYWETPTQAYAGETFTDACVMWDANMNPVKQNMYYWVRSANTELRQLEELMSNFTYEETAAIAANGSFYTGTGSVADTGMGGLWTAAQLADSSALAGISASVDTTAGYFSKDSGAFTDLFVLVNMSHPNEKASDTVTMTFDAGYTGVIVYLDGEASIYQLTDGACTVTLPSGEGAIVIPVA